MVQSMGSAGSRTKPFNSVARAQDRVCGGEWSAERCKGSRGGLGGAEGAGEYPALLCVCCDSARRCAVW